MDPSLLRARLKQEPFRPFAVETTDGLRVVIKTPKYALLTVHGSSLYVYTGRLIKGDEELVIISVPRICKINDVGHAKRKGRRAA